MTVQIAVKLPDELVALLDALVADGRFSSRSSAVRAGIVAVSDSVRRGQVDEAFRDGVLRRPDTSEAIEDARRLAVDAIEDEPWEPWW